MTLRVGTRASPLARIQANAVIERLRSGGIEAEAVPLSTRGDRSLGGEHVDGCIIMGGMLPVASGPFSRR